MSSAANHTDLIEDIKPVEGVEFERTLLSSFSTFSINVDVLTIQEVYSPVSESLKCSTSNC